MAASAYRRALTIASEWDILKNHIFRTPPLLNIKAVKTRGACLLPIRVAVKRLRNNMSIESLPEIRHHFNDVFKPPFDDNIIYLRAAFRPRCLSDYFVSGVDKLYASLKVEQMKLFQVFPQAFETTSFRA